MKLLFTLFCGSFVGLISLFYQQKPLEESIADGTEIYTDFCVQCHLPNGQGVENTFPPLAQSDYLQDIEKSVKALKYGLKGPIQVNGKTYNSAMATQGLDDEEIADVMNYILRNWGNQTNTVVTEAYVSQTKQ